MSVKVLIASTRYTPEVSLNEDTNELVFSGRSFPDNSGRFYEEVSSALTFENDKDSITLQFMFEYVNSSSIISILKLIREIEERLDRGDVKIHWHYDSEDDEMMNIGKDIERIVTCKFQYRARV